MENNHKNLIFDHDLRNFTCPITGLIMANPVDDINGHTYEEEAIETWFSSNSTDPMTQNPLTDKSLRQNRSLKNVINDLLVKNFHLIAQNELYLVKKLHGEIENLILDKNLPKIKFKLSTLIDYRYFTNNFYNNSEYSAFYLSSEHSSVEITKLIFDYLFEKDLLSKMSDPPSKWKPVHLTQLVTIYQNENCNDKINFLFEKYESLITNDQVNSLVPKRKKSSTTCLYGSNGVQDPNKNPIVQAAMDNNESLFKNLLSLNADIYSIDSKGLNSFYYAIKNENAEMFKLIMQKHGFDQFYAFPLQLAIELYPNNYHLYDEIINLNQSYLNMTDRKSRTVLFYACEKKDLHLVIFLLNKKNIDVSHTDMNLENCLHFAVRAGSGEIIAELIKHRIDVNQKNSKSKSPFDLASKKQKKFILKLFQNIQNSNYEEITKLNNYISVLQKRKKLNRILNRFKNNFCLGAVGNAAGKIILIDLSSGNVCASIQAHDDQVADLEFSLEGDLYSCSPDGTIKKWDLEKINCIAILNNANCPYLIKLFSQDILFSIGKDNVIRKWNLLNGSCVASLSGHTGQINCLRFIKNWLVSASADGTIIIWNLVRNTLLNILPGDTNSIIYIHPLDNSTLISASSDRTIKIWNLETLQAKILKTRSQNLGYDMLLQSADMVDKNFIIYSSDMNIYGQNINSQEFFGPLSGHSSDIAKLKSFDGEKLVTVSSNGEVKVWNLKTYQCDITVQPEDSKILCLQLMPKLDS